MLHYHLISLPTARNSYAHSTMETKIKAMNCIEKYL